MIQELVLILIVSCVITYTFTSLLIPRLKRFGLTGKDVNKSDKQEVAEMGGIAIVAGFTGGILLAVFLNSFFSLSFNLVNVLAALITIHSIAFIGIIDDLLDILCSKGKICLQACYPGVSTNPEVLKTHFQDIYSKHPKRPMFICPSGWEYEDHNEIIQLLLKRKIRISPLISHCISSDNAPETYRLMLEEPQKILGIVLKWT